MNKNTYSNRQWAVNITDSELNNESDTYVGQSERRRHTSTLWDKVIDGKTVY